MVPFKAPPLDSKYLISHVPPLSVSCCSTKCRTFHEARGVSLFLEDPLVTYFILWVRYSWSHSRRRHGTETWNHSQAQLALCEQMHPTGWLAAPINIRTDEKVRKILKSTGMTSSSTET